MPLLFSYGTLQREDVQVSTFGRRLHGQPDTLPRFETSLVAITDPQVAGRLGISHHTNVRVSGADDRHVAGMAFEVTDAEIAAVDAYEAPFGYARIVAVLGSGRAAWVYVHAG